MADKYKAVWVSHSSISDFISCPRAYFLKNVYKDPKSNSKMKIVSPALSLGTAVHGVLEGLSELPTDDRFNKPLMQVFQSAWDDISGKKGGFISDKEEREYKERGEEMIRKVEANPGPLAKLAVKIKMDLPHYWLSEEDEIILCGKIDWLEYLPESDGVNIIDFKTGKKKEDPGSLQLDIYQLLVHNCQNRKVEKASYWYLAEDSELEEKDLPDIDSSRESVLKIAKKVKLARQLDSFKCPEGEDGCMHCKPFEAILRGEGEYVGKDDYGANVYMLRNVVDGDGENREGELL